ncbi:MAG: CRISPR-associated protein Cas2 [Spirochaetia bacterium]
MFVAVSFDLSNDDNVEELKNLLGLYGFSEVHTGLWESAKIMEKYLARLKRDIDRCTDYYDTIRIYQYPLEGLLVLTSLKYKRWTRVKVKP